MRGELWAFSLLLVALLLFIILFPAHHREGDLVKKVGGVCPIIGDCRYFYTNSPDSYCVVARDC